MGWVGWRNWGQWSNRYIPTQWGKLPLSACSRNPTTAVKLFSVKDSIWHITKPKRMWCELWLAENHFKRQTLSCTNLASYGNFCYTCSALDRAKNYITSYACIWNVKSRQDTATELNVASKFNVTRPFNVLGVPSNFLTENRHEVAVVSQEPRMKKEDSKWDINDHCHGSESKGVKLHIAMGSKEIWGTSMLRNSWVSTSCYGEIEGIMER